MRLPQSVLSHLDVCPHCEASVQQLDELADPMIHALRLAALLTVDDAVTVSFAGDQATPSAPQAPALGPPGRLGRFELRTVLGEGGFGRVYRISTQSSTARWP